MTKAELLSIMRDETPGTRRIAKTLADTLIAVLDDIERERPGDAMPCPKCGVANGNSFALGYGVKARVIGARISEVKLP